MDSPGLFEVTKQTLSLVAAKYERTEKSLDGDVTALRNWMKTQPHLPEILDDRSIQNFFFLNKCSVERTKRSLDMYYTLRSKLSDMYENTNPKCSQMKQVREIEALVPLPKLTQDMYRVLVFKMLNKNLIDKLEPQPAVSMALNLQEIRLKEDVMYGDVYIWDMEGITFGYVMKLTPSFLAKAFAIYEKIYSIPLKGLYFINCSPFVNMLVAVLKKLLKPKIFNRIHVCETYSILNEAFSEDMLPKDYGGTEKSVEELNEVVKMKLKQYEDRFDLLDNLCVDESLRPEKLKNDDILGFYGNFKKMDVD